MEYITPPTDVEFLWIRSLKDQHPYKKGDITWNHKKSYYKNSKNGILEVAHPEGNRYCNNYYNSFEIWGGELCNSLTYEIY